MPGEDEDDDAVKGMGRTGYLIWLGAVEAGAGPLEAMFVTSAFFRGISSADKFMDEPDADA